MSLLLLLRNSPVVYTKTGQGVAQGFASGLKSIVLAGETYNKAGTGIARGVATGPKATDRSRSGAGIAEGTATGTRTVSHTDTGVGVAEGVASGGVVIENNDRAGEGVAEGVASGEVVVIPAEIIVGGVYRDRRRRPREGPRRPLHRRVDKTGTGIAIAVTSGGSSLVSPSVIRRRFEDELLVLELV